MTEKIQNRNEQRMSDFVFKICLPYILLCEFLLLLTEHENACSSPISYQNISYLPDVIFRQNNDLIFATEITLIIALQTDSTSADKVQLLM